MFNSFSGMNVVESIHAYKMVPIFPDKPNTKRRKRRTMGKFGSLYRMQPLAYQTPHGIVAHPKLVQKLRNAASLGGL